MLVALKKIPKDINREDIDSLIELIALCSWRLELAKVQFPLSIRRQVTAEDFISIQEQSDELNNYLKKKSKTPMKEESHFDRV